MFYIVGYVFFIGVEIKFVISYYCKDGIFYGQIIVIE